MPKKVILIFVVFFTILGIVFFPKNLFPAASNIILHRNSGLQQTDGRTTILLLGTGGAGHDGPNLTDTIMLASLDIKNDKVTLVSIPRDLWIPDLNAKINTAYATGEEKRKGGGLVLAKGIVKEVTGQEVNYGFRIDFTGFVKAVDLIDGIDVNVDEQLDDYHYPIDGEETNTCSHTTDEITQFTATVSAEQELWDFFPCRYKHLHVDAGVQHMNGITALEFVRSRHGAGSEGTDFARSRRQQRVIEAFREKVFSVGTLTNIGKVIGLYNILKDSIDTDIPQEDFAPFYDATQKLKQSKIENAVIDFGDESQDRSGLLIQGPISAEFGYASILMPRVGNGDFSEIQHFVTCEVKVGGCSVSPTPGVTETNSGSKAGK